MRCARCDFENIPGQARCIRCGSVLEAGGNAAQIDPPRMPAWRRPFRTAMRSLRRCHVSREEPVTPRLGRAIVGALPVGLVLSVVPGLGHLVEGRAKEVLWLVGLWLLLILAGLFTYGSSVGLILIGLAIGVHAWIAAQCGLFRAITDIGSRAWIIVVLALALWALYWGVARVATHGLRGAHMSLTIPAMNIRAGDYLLVRRIAPDTSLGRGALVLIYPEEFRNNIHQGTFLGSYGPVIGQIAGLPGETIGIQNGYYVVADRRLDPNSIPVPRWLQRYPPQSAIRIPPDSYFVSSEYTVGAPGNARAIDQAIGDVCVVKASAIYGRAFMHWWPLGRRGFME